MNASVTSHLSPIPISTNVQTSQHGSPRRSHQVNDISVNIPSVVDEHSAGCFPPPPPPPSENRKDQWRQYGIARRHWLIENDVAATTAFRMNAACSIYKYFALADRVIAQFKTLCENETLEDAYVMGYRLITFLSRVLPKHPSYITAATQKKIMEQHLSWIQAKMQQIAYSIDEEQLNLYITNDFDPILQDDDEDDGDEDDSGAHVHYSMQGRNERADRDGAFPSPSLHAWESFPGWSVVPLMLSHLDPQHPPQELSVDIPSVVDTDESSQDIEEEQFAAPPVLPELIPAAELNTAYFGRDNDPELDDVSADDDDSEEHQFNENAVYYGTRDPYEAGSPMQAPSILKKIARERVYYETDSEAADSWAQSSNDDGAASEATGYSATEAASSSLSCDPARMAFREIMTRHSQQLLSLQQEMDRLHILDAPPPPKQATPPVTSFLSCYDGGLHDNDGSNSLSVLHVSFIEDRMQRQLEQRDSPPPPVPPTNSPEEFADVSNVLQQKAPDVRYIGFSTHTGIRRLP